MGHDLVRGGSQSRKGLTLIYVQNATPPTMSYDSFMTKVVAVVDTNSGFKGAYFSPVNQVISSFIHLVLLSISFVPVPALISATATPTSNLATEPILLHIFPRLSPSSPSSSLLATRITLAVPSR